MDVSAIALQGLAQADADLEAAVAAVAGQGASSANGANLDVVSLASQMVAMSSAEALFQINASVLKTADEVQKNVLDITA